jgi:hypothetical protein
LSKLFQFTFKSRLSNFCASATGDALNFSPMFFAAGEVDSPVKVSLDRPALRIHSLHITGTAPISQPPSLIYFVHGCQKYKEISSASRKRNKNSPYITERQPISQLPELIIMIVLDGTD